MFFTQIWYLHKQGLQDQNKGITNCAEFTLQWRNYPIWRYVSVRSRSASQLNQRKVLQQRKLCYKITNHVSKMVWKSLTDDGHLFVFLVNLEVRWSDLTAVDPAGMEVDFPQQDTWGTAFCHLKTAFQYELFVLKLNVPCFLFNSIKRSWPVCSVTVNTDTHHM